jgi:hypothetical protein
LIAGIGLGIYTPFSKCFSLEITCYNSIPCLNAGNYYCCAYGKLCGDLNYCKFDSKYSDH